MAIMLGNPQGLLSGDKALTAQVKDWLFKVWQGVTGGLVLASGSKVIGSSSLVAGVATINTPKISSSAFIFLTPISAGNLGTLYENQAARIVGTSFQVKSTNTSDTSAFNWFLVDIVNT